MSYSVDFLYFFSIDSATQNDSWGHFPPGFASLPDDGKWEKFVLQSYPILGATLLNSGSKILYVPISIYVVSNCGVMYFSDVGFLMLDNQLFPPEDLSTSSQSWFGNC